MKQLTRPVIGPSVAACTVAPDVWASRSGVPTMETDVAEPAELTFTTSAPLVGAGAVDHEERADRAECRPGGHRERGRALGVAWSRWWSWTARPR